MIYLPKILMVVSFLCEICIGSRRMYETISNKNATVFDCLYNLITTDNDAPGMKRNVRFENIPFCRQFPPIINDELVSINDQQWTFDQLRQMNISVDQLFDWYAPIDIIEEYFLGKQNGIFVNCSQKGNFWFGSRCQYTFDSNNELKDILWNRFDQKDYSENDLLSITNGTCYSTSNDQCQSILCLDWREICDGKIDCRNGFDERYCDQLEINECDEKNEYRCLNGQCIDKTFYRDQYADCMDYSDEMYFSSFDCFYKFDIRCEDHRCPNMWFSCGDGYCYDGPSKKSQRSCRSQRDYLYFQQMAPSALILFSHLYVIYNDTKLENICYNESLCPYLFKKNPFELSLNNLTCQSLINRTDFDMIKNLKLFVQSCSLLPEINRCSLFECNDGSKCLSQHRLSDGYQDCSHGEDEYQNNTCLLNHSYRFVCDHGTRCIHPSNVGNKIRDCHDGSDETSAMRYICFNKYTNQCRTFRREPRRFNVIFEQICNGIIEVDPDSEDNTDESDCLGDEWNCLNPRTICDDVWNCPDGQDELGCGIPNLASRHCNKTTHFCLDIKTGSPICLSLREANDGIIHCIGSTDERSFCRIKYPYESVYRYRCQNSDKCISPYEVCNCYQDCPLNDDEEIACLWINNGQKPWCDRNILRCRNGEFVDDIHLGFRCDRLNFDCPDGEDELFCDLIDQSFLENFHLIELEEYRPLNRQLPNSIPLVIWYCNRGLYVRSSENTLGYICLCPIYYYGDRCQFQRKRLNLIIQIEMTGSFNRNSSTMKFIVLLIRENSKRIILSHEQFVYTPLKYCLPKYLIHLVYPINDSLSLFSNDSIQILMFTSLAVRYRTSWTFIIPFHFLPVQRIVKRLLVSDMDLIDHSIEIISTKTNISSCSEDSFHAGFDLNLNRDICVCPLNRIGSRCLIQFNPCTKYSCNNHGQCLSNGGEHFHSDSPFRCICDVQWFGKQCEHEKFRLNVTCSKDIIISLSSIGLVHIIVSHKYREATYLTSFHRFDNESCNLIFYFEYIFDIDLDDGFISFIQLFKHLHHVDYYLLSLIKQINKPFKEIQGKITQSNRCPSINELLSKTILSQPYLRRVKNYQQLCLTQNSSKRFQCFHDEQLMCLCDKTNHAYCFNLNSTYNGCPWNECSQRGICVQNHNLCPTDSFCICESCSYGSICQFTSKGYILSLDAIIGSHIKPMIKNVFNQTNVIKITFLVIILLNIIGISLNILSIGTFTVKDTQQVGCGFYLLISSIIGLLTIVMLMFKIILLLIDKQNKISCSLIEFVLKWFLTSSDWLNCCVAVERCVAVICKTTFSRSKSRSLSKWITITVIISIGLISLPELLFRQMILDTQDQRIWCVFTLNYNRSVLFTFYTISNVFLFLLPLIINSISSIIIIRETFRSKQQSTPRLKTTINRKTKWEIEFMIIKKQLIKQKHILLGPLLFAALSVPRIVFVFIFVCTKLDQRPFLSLFAYLIAFVPSMSILVAFIVPSVNYRTALSTFIKRIRLNRIRN